MRTSYNNLISGDKLRNPLLRLAYLLLSLMNLVLAMLTYFPLVIIFRSKLKLHKRVDENSLDLLSSAINVKKHLFSDSRILCYDILALLLNKRYKTNPMKKKEIRILDIGCGSGRFYYIFTQILSELDIKIVYTGIDIYKHNSIEILCENDNFTFTLVDANEFVKNNKVDYDIVFSQSVLEHMKYDGEIVDNLYKSPYLMEAFQIHLVPSVVTVLSYVFHGYRHYSLLNTLVLFRRFYKVLTIYPVGNWANGYAHLHNRLSNKFKLESRAKRHLYNSRWSPIFYGIVIND